MFTGIVQSMGVVQAIRREPPGICLVLRCPELLKPTEADMRASALRATPLNAEPRRPIAAGASVCVSGVCLTVTSTDQRSLSFDVVPETLSRSTLGELQIGGRVNLEPSLGAGDAMDGHVVQGHVDGKATVRRVQRGENGHVVSFACGPELMPYVIPKGSIAIDGVSLTIASVQADTFSVALIPTTLAVTTLGGLSEGDRVNVETDILARTVVSTLERWRATEVHGSRVSGLGSRNHLLQPETRHPKPESPLPFSIESLRDNGWA